MSSNLRNKRILVIILPALLLLVAGGLWMRGKGGDSASPASSNLAATPSAPESASAANGAQAPTAEQAQGRAQSQSGAQSPHATQTSNGASTAAGSPTMTSGANHGASHGGATASGATASGTTAEAAKTQTPAGSGGLMSAITGFFKKQDAATPAGAAKSTLNGAASTTAKLGANGAAVAKTGLSPNDAAPIVGGFPSNGAAPAAGAGAPTLAAVAPKAEEKKEPVLVDGCVTLTFHHKATPGHGSEEACGHHKNLIKIKHPNFNASSVCIRVNRTPVAFTAVKGKPGEFVIPAVAGPKAVITARYCVGVAKCNEDCTVPKDEFLSAIGGGENDDSGPVAQWDSGDAPNKDGHVLAKIDGDLKREMDELDVEKPAAGAHGDASVFPGWVSEIEVPACGVKQAMR